MKKCLASLGALTMALMVVLTGCDSKPASSGASSGQAVNDAAKDIAGDYILDATPLGMPLQIYLNIGEDGSFRLSNQLTDGQDKVENEHWLRIHEIANLILKYDYFAE